MKKLSEKASLKEKRRYWNHCLSVYEKSGLTQKQFAQENGLKARQLSAWKNRLISVKKVSEKTKTEDKTKVIEPPESNFIELKLSEPKELSESVEHNKIIFLHASGFKIEWELGRNKASVKEALQLIWEVTRC